MRLSLIRSARKKYLLRKSQGLCVGCGKEKDTERVKCKICADKDKISNAKRVKKYKKQEVKQMNDKEIQKIVDSIDFEKIPDEPGILHIEDIDGGNLQRLCKKFNDIAPRVNPIFITNRKVEWYSPHLVDKKHVKEAIDRIVKKSYLEKGETCHWTKILNRVVSERTGKKVADVSKKDMTPEDLNEAYKRLIYEEFAIILSDKYDLSDVAGIVTN